MSDKSKKLTDEEIFKRCEDVYSVYSKAAKKELSGDERLLREFQSSDYCKFSGSLKGLLKTSDGKRKLVISRVSLFLSPEEEIVDLPPMSDLKQMTEVSKSARSDVRAFLHERDKRELELMRRKLKYCEEMKKETQKKIEVLEKRLRPSKEKDLKSKSVAVDS